MVNGSQLSLFNLEEQTATNSTFKFLRKNKIKVIKIAESEQSTPRQNLAIAFCAELLKSYWNYTCRQKGISWKILKFIKPLPSLRPDLKNLAIEIGHGLSTIPISDAGYIIGNYYTSLLPDNFRAKYGVYYTPPTIVERLIEIISDQEVNWQEYSVLDPACGGSAFLTHVTRHISNHLELKHEYSAEQLFSHIAEKIRGIEIDPFAAWMAQTLLEISTIHICNEVNRRLPLLVENEDALRIPLKNNRKFNLIIGNPPYGKVSLEPDLRKQYLRSIYGHANYYGLFTDLAVRLTNEEGLIAFITPTSFLGGQYFKSLRNLMAKYAPPVHVEFISNRTGIFEDVLQETVLAVYNRSQKSNSQTLVNLFIPAKQNGSIEVQKIGEFDLPRQYELPWLFPRNLDQRRLLGRAIYMRHRLIDYGYKVSTGQLVWNRHKEQLKSTPGINRLPLIWAEAVTRSGLFQFNSQRKNHKPFFHVQENQNYLITHQPCVVVQRTTAKEQNRRLIAAVLPEEFFQIHKNGVVIENHLNIIKPSNNYTKLSLNALSILLNSWTVDQIFRCISGSVAVSAYELNAIPLPEPSEIKTLDSLIRQNKGQEIIEKYIASLYGYEDRLNE